MNHYLITVELLTPHRLHSYLMTDDKRYVEHTMNVMFDYAEKEKMPVLGVVLCTELDTGADEVRKIIGELDEQAKETLSKAKDFHRSTFLLAKSHPSDRILMELH